MRRSFDPPVAMILFRQLSFYLALLGIVGIAGVVIQLRAAVTEPLQPPPVAPVAKPFPRAIGASGLVEARHENTQIGVPVPGLVAAVRVAVWDRVEAGAPLLELDRRELDAARAALEAQRAVAEAQVGTAEAVVARDEAALARIARLPLGEATTERDVEAAETQLAVARAQLLGARAEVDAARAALAQNAVLLERLVVRAPIAGTVLQVNVRAGEYAATTSVVPIVLGNVDEVQVRADVDEQLAPRVRPGARAVGYIKGAGGDPIPMEFVRIEPFVVPKRSLTGSSAERVDTRVLQVVYRFAPTEARPVYVGQQMDLYIEEMP